MASRLLHLVVGECLINEIEIRDKNRFLIGQILPDAVLYGDKSMTHYSTLICDGNKKVMDFSVFFQQYQSMIFSDDLYAGYYLHLIEDCIFRQMLYYDLGCLKLRGNPGFLEVLYRDYHSMNGFLVQKYSFENTLFVPKNFNQEPINDIYPFDLKEFLKNMKDDFNDTYTPGNKYFKMEDAEKYISDCVIMCKQEYRALRKGKTLANPYELAWEVGGDDSLDRISKY